MVGVDAGGGRDVSALHPLRRGAGDANQSPTPSTFGCLNFVRVGTRLCGFKRKGRGKQLFVDHCGLRAIARLCGF